MISVPIRHIVYTALFAALFVAMSAVKIPLGFSPVPITLQNLAVMLAGAFLGARLGFASIAVVVALVALGLPLLHGEGGLALLAGGTGGFILAFPFCALLVGFFAGKLHASGLRQRSLPLYYTALFLIFVLFGSLASYIGGVPWLAAAYHFPIAKAMAAGFYPYLPGDAVKAVLATVVVGALHRYVPVVRTHRTDGTEASATSAH